MAEIAVELLDGLAGGGTRQLAAVRAVTGRDEALLDTEADAVPAERTTRLLAAVTLRIGEQAPVTPTMIRSLTAGDRERLLIGCAAATLGASADVVAHCPRQDCGELIEFSIRLDDLLALPEARARPDHHELAVRTEAGTRKLRFRLPTGADLEAAAHCALADPGSARTLLLDRCLLEVTDARGRVQPRDLSDDVASALEEAIRTLDPGAEAIAETECPECGQVIRTLLDGFALLSSATATGDRLLAEIDSLARAYHWSEAEILSLPLPRRRRYLDLILARSAA